MYIIKNAFRCISRAKGRNILIGIIALVIAVSACIGLSIRQAAQNAKANALDGLSVTASISYDRGSMMGQMGGGPGGFDPNQFADMMGGASELSLEEYLTYAEADTVEDFYYTLSAYLNGSDSLSPVTDEVEEETENFNNPGFPGMGDFGGKGGGRFNSGDFTIMGYSSDTAMTEFVSGTATILEGGTMFEEGTEELACVISQELAIYNNLEVGSTITLTNPSAETETYTLTVCGIYTSSETNDLSISMFGVGQDPANRIYMSANALQVILDSSEENSTTTTDSYGREETTAMRGTLSATYVFADPDGYYAFEEDVRTMGLDEAYSVSSADISAFENSIVPLESLSSIAGVFLLVILGIGGVILVVLNIFNVRERKYEVGVLTAMGMKKWKVATQFICEILVVTMLAVFVGAGIGAVSSVPVTNSLLASQIASQNDQQMQIDNSFGRPGNMGGMMGGPMGGNMGGNRPSNVPEDIPKEFDNAFESFFGSTKDYISQVDSAMDLTVVVQMLGIGLLLTLIASAASVLFIMRYDPLKILANRD